MLIMNLPIKFLLFEIFNDKNTSEISTQQIAQEPPLELKSTPIMNLPSTFLKLSKCHAIDHSSMQNTKKRLICGQYNKQSSQVIKIILIID